MKQKLSEFIKIISLRNLKRSAYFLFLLLFVFLILNFIFPIKIDTEYSTVVSDREGEVLHSYLTHDDKWRMKLEQDEISAELKQAFLYKEDRYFYYHPGFNPVAILRAFTKNVIKGKRVSGASTITMQLVRLIEPRPRTYKSKLIEIFRALQLELRYSKDEILLNYLSLVPYGGNIEGIKSASILYFGKSPNHLSLGEITSLAVIPNRPNSLKLGKYNEEIIQERSRWLHYFASKNLFSPQQIKDALDEPLLAKRLDSPKFAPHLSRRLMQDKSHSKNIQSTLDLDKQLAAERLVKNYIDKLSYLDIHNASVILIDNQSASVLAYVGSSDFNDPRDGGQVDGIQAIRSPGSTLKPFIYGQAFDDGIVTPNTVLLDLPVNYAGYSPLNYNKKFHGQVKIKKALSHSLNIPAVKLLNQINTQNFIQNLVDCGFKRIEKDRNKLGLSLALGGCGVSLEELAGLYSALANEGKFNALKYSLDEIKQNESTEKELVSPAAAYLLTDILTGLSRPDLPSSYANKTGIPKIAWKTGTSYGRRDAWSIGYNRRYTIGVWTGNFSGRGVPELNGSDIATPLLFELFNLFDPKTRPDWFAAPASIDYQWVCSESGHLPSEYCKDQVMDSYIPGSTRLKSCHHQKEYLLDETETYSYCFRCQKNHELHGKWLPNYPSELISFYEDERINYEKVPEHNPACERIFDDQSPSINSLANGAHYIIDQEDNRKLQLSCSAYGDVRKVFWFVNDRFYEAAAVNQSIFFEPERGEVKISCTDDKGRNSDIRFKVSFL